MKLLKKSAAKTVSILLSFVMIFSLFTVIPVQVQASEVCTDILTVDDTGATRTDYVNWTAQSGENHPAIGSAAVYSGNSAKGNDGIQLRGKNSSGIVITGSGGNVRKITVAWIDTNQNNDRYLEVYGSNTVYSSAADLYSSDAHGTLLDTFLYNDASFNEADGVYYSEVEVSDDYRFFGFRSKTGALYLSSVTIDWEIFDVNRVWNWATDYSSATCTFTDESGSHTEDTTITSEVTKQPSYLAEGVLTHTATVVYNGVTYRDVQTEPIEKPVFEGSVPYIDENGDLMDSPDNTVLLTGDEGNLSGEWYTFAADTSVADLTFSGDAKLVLCDGVTVTSKDHLNVNGTLTVYGQSNNSGILAGIASDGNMIIGGSGDLIINGGSYKWVGKNGYGCVELNAGCLTVNGGSFTNCNLSADNFLTVNGGTVNNDENTRIRCPDGTVTVNGGRILLRSDGSAVDCSSFVFGGGSFSAESVHDGYVYSHDKSVTLNWTNESDSIYVDQYGCWQSIGGDTYRFDGFNMTLQKDFVDQDGTKFPAGTYFSDDLRYKTLRPDIDRWNRLQQEINDSNSGDIIRLTSDCIAASNDSALVVPEEKDGLTIDLNGYTIDRGLADKDAVAGGNVITNNGTLILTGEGTVTGGKNTSNGGAIVNNGSLIILDTTISGNMTTKDGGAIYNSGTLTLNGTTITSNSAGSGTSGSGGAISAHAVTSEILSHTGVYMQFTIPDTSAEYQNQKVYVSDLTPVSLEGKSYYVFKCKVAAKDMTSAIQAQLIDGDKRSIIYTYSVQEYADYLLSHTAGNEEYTKAAPLVEKMLQYGAYSKEYFDKTDLLDDLGEVTVNAPKTEFVLPSGVTFEGATLSLKSETTLSLYFKSGSTLTFDMNGKTVETAKNGVYQVARIRGIAAGELKNSFTLKINGNDAVTYSPMNYCASVLNGGTTDGNLINVVKALYQYSQAANLYFGQ